VRHPPTLVANVYAVQVTERGWPEQFTFAHHCRFRRNTLVSLSRNNSVVVSTVGYYVPPVVNQPTGGTVERIPVFNAYYQTCVFKGKQADTITEATGLPIDKATLDQIDNPAANNMHNAMVNRWVSKLENQGTKALK